MGINLNNTTTGQKLVHSIFKSMGGRYAVYGSQVLSLVVLARMFTPEVFGIFAVVQVFAVFFLLFSEMGLGPALINEKKIPPKKRDGVFSVTLIIGLVIGITFLFFGPLISWFYDNPLYNLLVIPVAISVLFNTASIVPLAALQKESRFITIARCDVIAEFISLAGVFILLDKIPPIWALSSKVLTVSITKFILLWLSSHITVVGRPKFGRQLKQVNSLLGFSMYQFGFNVVNYFSRNLDNILVGKFFGLTSLGIYDKAYQLMRYPLMLLTFAMSPAIQPVMSEVRSNTTEFEHLHNKLVRYLSIVGLAAGIVIYILAEVMVTILLGEQWDDVAPLLKILSVSVPIQVVLSTSGGFFQAAGRADLLFKCGVFSACTNIAAITLGIWFGTLDILCWALVCSFSINFFQCYYIMGKYVLLEAGVFGVFKNLLVAMIGTLLFTLSIFFI